MGLDVVVVPHALGPVAVVRLRLSGVAARSTVAGLRTAVISRFGWGRVLRSGKVRRDRRISGVQGRTDAEARSLISLPHGRDGEEK